MRAGKDKRTLLLDDLQRDPRLRLSFGFHPKCVSPLIFRVTEEAERLKKLLSLPDTVAFGEVGLDTRNQRQSGRSRDCSWSSC